MWRCIALHQLYTSALFLAFLLFYVEQDYACERSYDIVCTSQIDVINLEVV